MSELDTFSDGIGISTLANDPVDSIQENSPIAINGVAIPENTVLQGGQGVRYFFTPEKAQRAAEVLQNDIEDGTVHVVAGFHEIEGQAGPDEVIGKVTDAGYSEGVGVIFEGEIMDEEIAQKVNNNYLDVSPSIARSLGERDEQMDAREVDSVSGYRDIAVVANGQPGAEVDVGPNPAVSTLSRDVLNRTVLDTLKEVAGVEFEDTGTGELDESEIPNDDYESHYLYPGETKSESGYPVVDAEGVLRKGNVESAHQLGCRGKCPSEDEHDSKLRELAQEFENVPEWAQEDTMSLDDAKETIADEYDIDVDTLDEKLTESDDGGDNEDSNTVILVE